MKDFKISIITVVYNCKDTIEGTILSVLGQTFENYEYIVIDGASTDGTIDVIRKYEKKIHHIKSEKDNGLYDAMNKGMKLATGDFCMFLNAGDVLYKKSTLREYANVISDPEKIYFGRAVMTDRNKIYRLRPPEEIDIKSWLSKGNLPNHQSMLFPKSFYKENEYDLRFKTASDDDFKMRALLEHESEFLPQWTILFELGGVSRDSSSLKKIFRRNREVRDVLEKNKRYQVKSRSSYFKYVVKSIILWSLTKIMGDHYRLELLFNKFNRINPNEKNRFQPKF